MWYICVRSVTRTLRWKDVRPALFVCIFNETCNRHRPLTAGIPVFSRSLTTPVQHSCAQCLLSRIFTCTIIVKEMKIVVVGTVPSTGGLPAHDILLKLLGKSGLKRSAHNVKASSATGYGSILSAHSRRCSMSASRYGFSEFGSLCPKIELITGASASLARRVVAR